MAPSPRWLSADIPGAFGGVDPNDAYSADYTEVERAVYDGLGHVPASRSE